MTQVDQDLTQKNNALDSLDAVLSSFENMPANYLSDRSNVLDQILGLSNQRNSIANQIRSNRHTLLSTCAQYNPTLPTNTQYEINQRLLNGFLIKKAESIALDSTDLLSLKQIANQCLDIAGRTRERAIELLPSNESMSYQREDPATLDCTHNDRSKDPIYASQAIAIFPNPVKEQLNIFFEDAFSGVLYIFDLSGKTRVHVENIQESNSVNVSATTLPAGLYILTAKSTSGLTRGLKFVVIK